MYLTVINILFMLSLLFSIIIKVKNLVIKYNLKFKHVLNEFWVEDNL